MLPLRKTEPKHLILPCAQVRTEFTAHACRAIRDVTANRKSLTEEMVFSRLRSDPHGYMAILEALVYANAVNRAIGSYVLLRMRPHQSMFAGRLVDPRSLSIENIVADRLVTVGDLFLQTSGFMKFSTFYNEFLYLSLLHDHDVLITNHEN